MRLRSIYGQRQLLGHRIVLSGGRVSTCSETSTANSRTPSFTEWFGYAGGWNHNYNWAMEDSTRGNAQNFRPARYTVSFPDGRVETFRAVTWDAGVYRVRPGPHTPAQRTARQE